MDIDLLGGWLSERQLPNGGMNGRPEKLEDVGSFSPPPFPPRRFPQSIFLLELNGA